MDTQCTPSSYLGHTVNFGSGELRSDSVDGVMSEEEMEQEDEEDEQQLGENVETSADMIGTVVQRGLPAVTAQTQSSALDEWTGSSEGEFANEITRVGASSSHPRHVGLGTCSIMGSFLLQLVFDIQGIFVFGGIALLTQNKHWSLNLKKKKKLTRLTRH